MELSPNQHPMTRIVDIKHMPEEFKNTLISPPEPEISNALQLGEYIYKNTRTFPPDLLRLTEEKTLLSELHLKHLRLTKEGISHLCVVLPFVRQIFFADFTDMQLDSEDIKKISEPLCLLSSLEDVCFASNPIRNGAKFLIRPFQFLSKLQILDLTDCYLAAEDFAELCPGFNHLQELLLLKLSLNPIGDLGADKLFKAMPKMPRLVELELFTCMISDKSLKSIQNGLAGSGLQSVLLGNNKFSAKAEGKLKSRFPYVHFGVEQRNCSIF